MKVCGDWFWREQIEVMLEETTRTGLNDFSLIDKLYIYVCEIILSPKEIILYRRTSYKRYRFVYVFCSLRNIYDTSPLGHNCQQEIIADRTTCQPDTLPNGHVADRRPCRVDTLPTVHKCRQDTNADRKTCQPDT